MTIKPPHILPIRDALRLYFLIGKHIDPKSQQTNYELIKGITSKLTADEYGECICILTGTAPDEMTKDDGPMALKAFIDGLAMNKIIQLVAWMDVLK